MIFRRREIRLICRGTDVLFLSSSLATRLTSLFSRTVIGLVSLTTLFLSDVTSHACEYLLWQGRRYVLPLQHHRYHCGSREVLVGQTASRLGNEAANHEVVARSIL